jgi:hypothetical protein
MWERESTSSEDPERDEIDLERDNHGGGGKENGWRVHLYI